MTRKAFLLGIILVVGDIKHFNVVMDLPASSDINVFSSAITLFLCGDVMTGRGIDQVLPHSVNPRIYESYIKNAADYVLLAEKENGQIERPLSYAYIWGDAMEVWEQMAPDLKIINLETCITVHEEPCPGKGINYRMHPRNVSVLTTAEVDFCSLANNHIMDWGRAGLLETLQTLDEAGIVYAGAGSDLISAEKPAVLKANKGRVIILAYGAVSSGVPTSWTATVDRPGVNLLPGLNSEAVKMIADQVKAVKQIGDIVIFSVHWGSNWGYEIPDRQRSFAHQLIDDAGVDLIYGHSSHHPRGIEMYKGKLILYGAGDFINDYEGIRGYEKYRDNLTVMYFPRVDPVSGKLISMKMVPMQIKNFRLNHVSSADAKWLHTILNRESRRLGAGSVLNENNSYTLIW